MEFIRNFQKKAAERPNDISLSNCGDTVISYRELDEMSGRVYRYLKDHGIGREDFVNILLPRGVEPLAAVLGVWKAGAAFVMLEDNYPAERIDFIQKDCGCKLIMDVSVWQEIVKCEPLSGSERPDDHDAAFAVYTSGSTGAPKGVLHEYGNIDLIAVSLNITLLSFGLIAPLNFVATIIAFCITMHCGSTMYIIPFEIVKNPPALAECFVSNSITQTFCAPSVYALFRNIPGLKLIIVSSEPAYGIWSDSPELSVINVYAMSEGGFIVTTAKLDTPNETAPIGKPQFDLDVTLKDEDGSNVADGEAGEICFPAAYTRGYINRPEETAQVFINGIYHTRDLGKRLPDGDLVVIGRIDDMIKINGNRVEPAEIENAFRRITGMKQVIAKGFTDGENAFVCVYYADNVGIDTEQVRTEMLKTLPYYMIPSRFIKLDKLPRTQSGKLSRRLLPKPETETVRSTYTAPANPTEKLLCDSMAQVLGLSNVGADEDFYELGGSSVSSMKLIVSCPLEGLDIGMIFMGRTAQKIAALYLETRMSTVSDSLILDDPQRKFPLTQTQLGIYLESERREGEAVYNNPYLTRFPADTPPEKLRNALEVAVKAHPGLFARIVTGDDGMPAMIYCPVSSDTHLCDITNTTEKDFTGIRNSLLKPFNIKTDRLFRLDIFVTESAVYLFMDFHHIVYDGTSAHILMNDMISAWNGIVPEPEKYTAYHAALDEKSARETQLYQRAKTWYLEQFGETESAALPDGDVKEKELSYGEIKAELDVSPEELRAFCEKHKITENIAVTAAFGFLLSAYTRRSDAVFATIYNGRKDLRTDRTVSMLVKTLPVLCRTSGPLSVNEYLSTLKEQILGAMANDIFSFAEAAAAAGISSDVLFAWQDEMHDDSSLKSLGAVREELPFNATGDALSIDLVSLQGKLVMEIQFHKNRYSKAYIENMARCYGNVLREMLSKERLDEISLVSGEEEEKILSLSKGETLDYDKSGTWVDLFRAQADKTPERNAVTDSEGSFTYRELDRISDCIAAYLLNSDVKPNTFVAVKMGRSKLFLAAVLGIHKAGAAYLPIDADYPEERIAYMLEDSETRIILTEDTVRDVISKYENAKPVNLAETGNLAYMIYTSGSTGKPKGVMIPHRAMLNFVHFIRYRWHLTESSRIACHSNFSFDASVEDLYPALTVGGCVFIVPEKERHDIFEMRKYIRANGINGGSYSTQFGQLLAGEETLDVDYLCVGGEAMTVVPNARGPVYNAYGPTEFTVDATYFELDKTKKYDNIPIGRPVANCRSFIVGLHGELLPHGIAGELCLAGPQIAEGYWKREELTAEKFVDCPYLKGQKMYRTGDLARYNEEGQLEYLGRIDTQVKLRGFRIELGEIESRASQFAGIRSAAAEVRKDNLVLYYVSDNETDNDKLKAFLSESLTEYMIPSVYVRLPEMPFTPNGKIDRKALPEPSVGGRAAYIEPATDKERIVAEIMGSILGVSEPVSAEDSFFELGGDSIKAIRMVSLLRERSVQISVAGIMKNKTVRSIAANAVIETAAVISQEPYEGYIKDTAIIAYFNDLGLPEPWHYNQAQLYSLAERTELRALQKAWDSLTYQHDMLRAVVHDGRIFVRSADTVIAVKEYSAADKSEITAICSEIQSHIDMREALVRAALIHAKDADYLFIAAHHLIIDGVSWRVIRSDLETAYSQAVSGIEIKLPAKTNTYKDFAELQHRYRDSYILAREIPYWTAIQKKVEALPCSAAKAHDRRFEHITVFLNEQETYRFLHTNFGILKTDINDALLTAVGAGYRALTGETAVSVQLEGHGREDMGEHLITDRTVGWFTTMYPVVLEDLNGDVRHDLLTVKETLHRVPNKGVGYNVLRYLEGKENIPVQPDRMEKILFNYLGDMGSENSEDTSFFRDSDIFIGEEVSSRNNGDPDLTINCIVINGRFELRLDYNADVFGSDGAQIFADSVLSEMKRITVYLSECDTPAVTASDLGETEWTEEEFEKIMNEFAARGERPERIYPMLPMQEGMLFKNVSEPDSLAYRMADIYEADAVFTEKQLRRVLERLGKKHEVLRTAIIYRGVGQPRQAIVDRQLGLTMLDISDSADPENELALIRRNILKNGFDLQEKPLFGLTCVKSSPEHSYFIVSVHHAVIDGWCSALYMNDLDRYLREALSGFETADEAAVSGRYEKAVREILDKDKNAGLKYWRELLSDYETQARIPSYGIVPEDERSDQDTIVTYIDEETTSRLTDICRDSEATVSNGAELVWGLVNAVCSRTEDVVFAKVVSGRDNTSDNVDDIVGLFINSIPVRIKFDRSTTVRQALSQLQKQNAASNDFDHCALEQIQKQTSLGSDLFQSVFAFENYNSGKEETNTESLLIPVDIREEIFDDISPVAMIDNGKLVFAISYNTERYRESEIKRISAMIGTLVKEITEHPDRPLSELELLDSSAKTEVLELSTGETLGYDRRGTWVDLFRTQAEKTPERNAVTDSEGSFTYRELDSISDSIAAYLLDNGVKPNTFIAVKMGRSKLFLAAVLGIHKAGAAYLPIDADYPEERIAYMLEDSETRIILTEDTVRDVISKYENAKPVNLAETGNLAYMIYTSGSTGKPKGVMIPHRAMLNFVHFIAYRCMITENSRIVCYSSFSFDASVENLYPALTVGGSVFIVPEKERHDIFEMRRYLRINGITGGVYPTRFGLLLAGDEMLDLDFFSVGGEAMTAMPHVSGRVYNAYGPTEFTVCGSYYELDKTKKYDSIPIGRPITNCYAFIVGLHGELLPRGIAGELCLAGPQIAEGYWKREELTAEKFVTCPYLKGQKMYRTGDLARYNEEGQLEYLGRIDTQVKLRGFRIELGEIESRASQFEGIKAVAAEVRKDNLVLYYTSENEIDINKLKSFLSESLTEYMIPSVYMRLPEMPFTPNGKIDRKALPEPDLSSLKAEYEAPRNETEKKLCDAFAEVLGIDKDSVGINDDFIMLGGSSIKSMRLTVIAGIDGLVVNDIYRLKTPKNIAKELLGRGAANSALDETEARKIAVPATAGQIDMVDYQFANLNSVMYNIPELYEIDSFIDENRLISAVNAVIENHPALSTQFEMGKDGVVIQRYKPEQIEKVSIRTVTGNNLQSILNGLVRPFKIFNAPLFRAELFRFGDKKYLFMDMHHAISDGESMDILFSDIYSAYHGNPLNPDNYYSFILNESRMSETDAFREAREHFRSILGDTEWCCIPMPDHESWETEPAEEIIMTGLTTDNIKSAEARLGVSGNVMCITASILALTQYCDNSDIHVNWLYNNRSDARYQNTVGKLFKILPVAVHTGEYAKLSELLAEVNRQVSEGIANSICNYAELTEATLKDALEINYLFSFNNTLSQETTGFSKSEFDFEYNAVGGRMGIYIVNNNGEMAASADYQAKAYEEGSVARFLQMFRDHLRKIVLE